MTSRARTLTGFLCTNLWMACVKTARSLWLRREMLGIAAWTHAHNSTFNWKNAIHTLCIGETGNCPHATP
jgi:hypothetical protein